MVFKLLSGRESVSQSYGGALAGVKMVFKLLSGR